MAAASGHCLKFFINKRDKFMPERNTFGDENSSSTLEPQLLQSLPFVQEGNRQGKTLPPPTTLNKAPLLTCVNQNNVYIKIQIPLCSKATAKCRIHFLFPDVGTFLRRTRAIGEPMFLQKTRHFWIIHGPPAAEAVSRWAGNTFPA